MLFFRVKFFCFRCFYFGPSANFHIFEKKTSTKLLFCVVSKIQFWFNQAKTWWLPTNTRWLSKRFFFCRIGAKNKLKHAKNTICAHELPRVNVKRISPPVRLVVRIQCIAHYYSYICQIGSFEDPFFKDWSQVNFFNIEVHTPVFVDGVFDIRNKNCNQFAKVS